MKKSFYLLILNVTVFFSIIENASSQCYWSQGCSFTGSDSDHISIPHSSSLNITGSFTIEAWVNPVNATLPTAQIILQKRVGSNSNGYTLYLSSGRVAIRTNATTRLAGKTVLQSNKWTHIAGTYNQSSGLFCIYINGNADTSVVYASASPSSNSDSVKIGVGFNSPFSGILDEVRIWNRDLSAAEVKTYRRTSLGTSSGKYTGLVLSMTFQTDGTSFSYFNLNDLSENNNNGFNRGAAAFDMSNRPLETITINEAIELNGGVDYLAGADNANVSPGNVMVLEAWVFPKVISDAIIIHKGPPSLGSGTNYQLAISGRKIRGAVNDNFSFFSNDSVPINRWSHIAFAYSGSNGTYAIYLNGKLSSSGTNMQGTVIDGADSVYIGGTDLTLGFFGYIDEVRITCRFKQQYHINENLFTPLNQFSDPSFPKAIYNFDGCTTSGTTNGPRLFFRGNSGFTHPGTNTMRPVSPLCFALATLSDLIAFQDGFYLKTSERRIPATGTSGSMTQDTLNVFMNEIISDINVFVALNHTAENSVSVTLIGPTGVSSNLTLNNSLADNACNIIGIFSDDADSSIVNGRYLSFSPKIKPVGNLNSAFGGTNTFGKWRLQIMDNAAGDTGRLYGWGIQFNEKISKQAIISSSAIPEGFYNSNSNSNTIIRDTMTYYLRYNFGSYLKIDSSKKYLLSDGSAFFTFNNTGSLPFGNFYIQTKHRNSIETWSAVPLKLDMLTLQAEYYFTTAATQAYGSNMIQVDASPVKFAVYSGDENQDGTIDVGDLIDIYNDVLAGASGYVSTDVNGDDFVDVSDLIITYNNLNNSVGVITP